MAKSSRIFLLVLLVFLVGCSGLKPLVKTPTVQVSSFRVLPTQELVPTFEIGLHVINPNAMALNPRGLSYDVILEGHRILTGATHQLPQIDAYGEGDILLTARPDLFSSLNLFSDLLRQSRNSFSYRLEATLDIGALLPDIQINKEGQIGLGSR